MLATPNRKSQCWRLTKSVHPGPADPVSSIETDVNAFYVMSTGTNAGWFDFVGLKAALRWRAGARVLLAEDLQGRMAYIGADFTWMEDPDLLPVRNPSYG